MIEISLLFNLNENVYKYEYMMLRLWFDM